MKKRTYLDAGVLIAAVSKDHKLLLKALNILDDPDRIFVSSDALRLEVFPHALYRKREKEIEALALFFDDAEHQNWNIEALQTAYDIASTFGLAAMDAVHIAIALAAKIDEFITTEKDTKPMFRVKNLKINSLAS